VEDSTAILRKIFKLHPTGEPGRKLAAEKVEHIGFLEWGLAKATESLGCR
jgi:hypothetical protein